jgi:uncharacterized repeat protein (TIGR03833 family)
MTYEVGSRYPKVGEKVKIVQKKDYASGDLTEGLVKDILTKSKVHHRGHKVRLTNGIIGRVQQFSDYKEEPPDSPTSDTGESTVEYKPSEGDLV